MPKILINEKDLTSPGLPGDYSNNKVLITGFCGYDYLTRKSAKIQPDDNGVYEFSSVADFTKTIGKCAPTLSRTESSPAAYNKRGNLLRAAAEKEIKWLEHYGNQMAYELLNLGYTIYYMPIEKSDDDGWVTHMEEKKGIKVDKTNLIGQVKDMAEDRFWEIFKDKSLYDFRFITHGFLSSTVDNGSTPELHTFNKVEALRRKLFKVLEEASIVYGKDPYEMINATVKTMDQTPTTGEGEGNTSNEGELLPDSTPETETTETEEKKTLAQFLQENWNKIREKLLLDDWWNGNRLEENSTYIIKPATDPTDEYPYFSNIYKTFIGEPANPDEVAEDIESDEYISIRNAAQTKYVTTNIINNINTQIANLAEYTKPEEETFDLLGRGDCIALIELDESTYIYPVEDLYTPEARITEAINCMSGINSGNGKFCAMTVPSVEYKMGDGDVDFGYNKRFPGAFHYLTCYINSLKKGYAEWFAAAGYTRGVSGYVIDSTTVKLGEVAINALEPRYLTDKGGPKFACNVIANFRNSYYLWGNRTAHLLDNKNLVASHFLNIRQLCTTIKKQLYVSCRRFTFDPNSDTLWYNFVNSIKPTLERMKAEQGVHDYQILKVVEADMPKATLKARIRIIPIEAVEDFDLEISLEDSFGETTAAIAE